MTKKVMAIEVMDVVVSFVITRLRLNLLFACPLRVRQLLQVGEPTQRTGSPNFPSIVFRKRSSS